LSYRVRLGRRFEPPSDVRAFTGELERYFARELASGSLQGVHPGDRSLDAALVSVGERGASSDLSP